MRGERFYREAAERAEDRTAKDFFTHLAEQEVRHKKVFEGLSSVISITDIDATTWDEAMGYIEATVEREFFSPGAQIRTIPQGASLSDMVKQAIGFERQTLLFFYGLRDLVQKTNTAILDDIINEEKTHIRRLAEMSPEPA